MPLPFIASFLQAQRQPLRPSVYLPATFVAVLAGLILHTGCIACLYTAPYCPANATYLLVRFFFPSCYLPSTTSLVCG